MICRRSHLCFFLLFVCSETYSQTDSVHNSPRSFFGGQLGGGIRQMDFSALRQYQYFLNQPPDIAGNIHTTIYLGNPDKLFLSLAIGTTVSKEKKGIYSTYNTRANGSAGWFGTLLGYQVYRNNNRKFLKAIYASAGVNYTIATITSKAEGKTVLNADTSFFYEYSKAKNILITAEVMIELFNLSNKNSSPPYPLTLKLGYNIQFQNPQWSYYNQASQNPTVSRNVNLGGFYATLGINFWLKKGQAKSWFQKK